MGATEFNAPTLAELKSALCEATKELHESLKQALSEVKPSGASATQNCSIYLVIDALDELAVADQYDALTFLCSLGSLEFLQLLVTSRPHPTVQKALLVKAAWPNIVVDKAAIQEDIASYIDSVIGSSRLNELDGDVQRAIKTTLMSKGATMYVPGLLKCQCTNFRRFLWVSLQLDHLRSLMVDNADIIRNELKTLPDDLYDTYQRSLDRIAPASLKPKAIRALRWLAFARRPLLMHELIEACSLVEDLRQTPALIESTSLSRADIANLLADFLYLDPPLSEVSPELCTVTIAHASVQDFLVGNDYMAPAETLKKPLLAVLHGHICNADLVIAELCMAFVFSYNKAGVYKHDHPLLSYAWYHWDEHLEPVRSKTSEGISAYFRSQAAYILKNLQRKYSQHLHWLPKSADSQAALADALNVPYFYPEFEQFRLQDTRSSRRSRYLDEEPRTSKTIPHTWRTYREEPPSCHSLHRHPETVEFSYQPLHHQQQETRLLEILPSLSEHTSIECRLQAFPIELAPTYDALSYAWGQHEDESTIMINGQSITTRGNLHQILGNLRRRSEMEDGHLWIDAISINQANYLERSHQVFMMAKIYSTARRVLISFGAAAEGDARGVQNMVYIASEVMHATEDKKEALRTKLVDLRSHCTQLFQKPYWTRIWIIQEIVLARDLTILFGDHALGRQHLEACLSLLHLATSHVDTKVADLLNVFYILETRREFRERGGCDLLEIMQRFRHFECVDPRDRIYALLGLIGRLGPSILVDYSRSVEDVHAGVTMAILEHSGNLRVLSYHPVRYLRIRSWAIYPDKGRSMETSLIAWPPGALSVFKAGGSSRQQYRQESLQELSFIPSGIRLATIVQKLNVNVLEVNSRQFLHEIEALDAVQTQISQLNATQRMDVRWRTMLADRDLDGVRLDRDMDVGCQFPPRTREQEMAVMTDNATLFPHLVRRDLFIATRQKSDDLLLLGPDTADVGDIVVVLHGGDVPFVLHPCDGSPELYVLMGER
jgi:hypothetical protein